MGFFKNVIKSILQASQPTFSFENNQLKFLVQSDELYVYDLGEYDLKTRHDPYVLEAYTLKNSDIHLEFIKTDSYTNWNGLSRSFYESLLTEQLHFKSLEVLERFEIDHYEFTTYKIDNTHCLYLIFIWESQKDIFILDAQGKLFKGLIEKLGSKSSLEHSLSKKVIDFDVSLVKNNAIAQYFNQSMN